MSLNRTFVKPVKKIAYISGIFLCCIAIMLSIICLYLYYHPERIKSIMEGSLSAATGSSCTMESLSWSLRTGAIEAGGVVFETPGPQRAFSMALPFIRADLALGGPWGHRALILENIQINGISANFALHAILPEEKGASFAARMVQGLVGIFLFRDIVFQSGEILDGQMSASWEDQTIQVNQIHARAGADKPLFLSFALDVKNASRDMQLTAPNVNIFSANALDMNDLKFSGTLQAEDIQLQDAGLEIQRMGVQSKIVYSHARKNLLAENLEVDIKGLALLGKTGGRLPLMGVNLKAEGILSRYPVIDITNATLRVPQTKIHSGTRDILIKAVQFHIPDGRVDTEKRSIALPKVLFDTYDLKNILLAVGLKDGRINLTLQGEKTAILHVAAAYLLVPSDLDLSAADTIRIEAEGPDTGPWQVNAKLSITDLAFKNKAESLTGENISLTTRAEGVVDLHRSSMTFAAFFEAKTGEALYDRYYLNLVKNPIVASCKGTYQFPRQLLQLSEFKFDLTDILPLEIKGYLNQGGECDADFAVNVPQISLKPVFQLLLQEPYKTEMPLLAALETGGTVSAEFRIKEFENSRQVTGRIKWREGNLALPDRGASLKGIHLDLPVWYRTGSAQTPVDAHKGKLEVQSVTLPLLPEQSLSLLLDAGPNRISVDSPTVIHVPGGDLRLGPVEANNIFSPDITVQSRLAFEGLKLRPLLSGFMALPPRGTLTGMLDPVRYERNTVTSQGEIAAEVFGGKMIVSDLGASGVLTSTPVLKLNAHWDDLRLTEMTKDTGFGKIEGVLKGCINDFEIAYGQPQKFVLFLETVPKKGVPQTISIQAVDNIAQIGGGQSPFVGLAGAFASVFKKFTYEKIGIRASLENDMFTVNGTIREDGTEYLVKRRSFSGVNIVNQNPDNRISFKDMVKRILRITHKGEVVVE
ncbi:MAG: hypothetical protein HY881_23515 [Deltaproteobacteria bacterium]|nr:hypothetical protein [Deltaproteobacteria bacterium]